MPPVLIFAGLLALIYLLARKARAVGREAGVPTALVTLALGAAIK